MAMEEVMKHLGGQKDIDPVALSSELLRVVRLKNDELQAARDELIMGWDDVQSSNIGIKWMGRIDRKAFMKTCSERFPPGRAEINAHKLLCKWQEIIESSECCPFRVIGDEKGNLQKLVDEDSVLLQCLRSQWGDEIYNAVTTAMKEQYEYNCSGLCPVAELWNFKRNRKATLEEGIRYIVRQRKTLKRKST